VDPKACWNAIMTAVDAGAMAETADLCEDLENWLYKGGFAPDCIPPEFRRIGQLRDFIRMVRSLASVQDARKDA
jgi:hypothetical protein